MSYSNINSSCITPRDIYFSLIEKGADTDLTRYVNYYISMDEELPDVVYDNDSQTFMISSVTTHSYCGPFKLNGKYIGSDEHASEWINTPAPDLEMHPQLYRPGNSKGCSKEECLERILKEFTVCAQNPDCDMRMAVDEYIAKIDDKIMTLWEYHHGKDFELISFDGIDLVFDKNGMRSENKEWWKHE